MSNRLMVRNYQALEKAPVDLFLKVSFGASGAPTLVYGKGIKSVTRTSAGLYVINLQDTYQKLMALSADFVLASGVPAAPQVFTVSDASATLAAPAVTVQMNAASGASGALVATDPASGEVVLMKLSFSNTTAL